MKIRKTVSALLAITIMATIATAISCGKQREAYKKSLSDVTAEYRKKCPVKNGNGTTTDSVTLRNDTLTFWLSLSDKRLTTVNLDSAKSSITKEISENLRQHLVGGKCNLAYKYVSPKRTSTIVITPDELKAATPEKGDQ